MHDTLYPSSINDQPSMVTSRLAKREQKQLLVQTVALFVGAVVLLLAFIFVILPGVARVWSQITGTGLSGLDSEDTFAPQVPILAAPVSATNSAELKLSGYGEADSQLKVVINGEAKTEDKIKTDGTFEVSIALTTGENVITAYAIDAAGNESEASRSYTVVFDNEAPKLEISEPQNGQSIELRKNQQLTIKGTTEPHARVSVNGRTVLANSEGAFSTTYLLQEGENKFQLKAEDQAGNSTEQELIVNYRF